MDFVMQWLWCVLAFLGGSATGWVLVTVIIKNTNAVQAQDISGAQ